VLATVGGSADSALRETVEYLMRDKLDMSHVVQTVPDVEVRRGLTLMELPPTEPLDPTTARELAERYGVATVVLPRLDAVGTGWVVAVRVEDVAGGQLQAQASRRATDGDAIVETVDAVVDDLRRDIGETRAALANTPPLPQVLTPSLEALRRYRDAVASLNDTDRPRQTIRLLREALALDPEFAQARARLSAAYANMGQGDSAIAELRRALETPERLSDIIRRDRERNLRILTDFALWDESMFQGGYLNNRAVWLMSFRYVDSALTVLQPRLRNFAQSMRRFDPERQILARGTIWHNALSWAVWSGRLEELETLRDSLRVDPTPFWDWMSSLAAGEWDRADSLRLAVPDAEEHQHRLAVLDAARGRIRASHERTSSLRAPLGLFSIKDQALVLEVVYGVPGTDTLSALANRGLYAVQDYLVHGVRAALLGDTTEAKRVSARLRAARDSATSELFQRRFEPRFALMDAGVAMRRGDWQAAAANLEPIAHSLHEQGYGGLHDPSLIGWVLADVYAQLGQLEPAVLQLEAVLQGPTWYTYSAAHFKLGQLHGQVGDTAKSVEHYGTFLDAFTDPDPEYEWMVEEARAEVERLSRRPTATA
jgi:tetratricopeptide (TPR) repeat protein